MPGRPRSRGAVGARGAVLPRGPRPGSPVGTRSPARTRGPIGARRALGAGRVDGGCGAGAPRRGSRSPAAVARDGHPRVARIGQGGRSGEAIGDGRGDVEERVVGLDANGAHVCPADVATPARDRQQPTRVGAVKPAPGHAKGHPPVGAAAARRAAVVRPRTGSWAGRTRHAVARSPSARGRPRAIVTGRHDGAHLAGPRGPVQACLLDEARHGADHSGAGHDLLGDRHRVRVDDLAVAVAGQPGHELLFARALDRVGPRDGLDFVGDLGAREAPRDRLVVRGSHEEHARALLARAPGPAAAVRVGLHVGGGLDLDDPRHVAHVDAARGDVGGDEGLDPPLPERGQRPVSLGLVHLAGERAHDEARLGELARDARHVGPRAREDERLRVLVGEQQVHQRVDALARLDQVHDVLDVRVGVAQARALNVDRLLLEAIGQGNDVARERRRDQVRPALLRQQRQDRVEVLAEAEVEHRVGLVEDDRAQLARVDAAALEGVAQTPWGRDHDRRVGRQGALLVDVRGPPGHGRDADAQRLEEPGELVGHLLGQLARRRQDEDAWTRGAPVLHREIVEQIPDGEADGDGLARARLRGDAQIAPLERLVEHRLLNGGQRVVALGSEGRGERRADELREVSRGHTRGAIARERAPRGLGRRSRPLTPPR